MRQLRSISNLAISTLFLKALCSYLDPGSGSLLVQLFIAAIVGILATFRFWKSRLLRLFGIQQREGDDEDGEIETSED